MTKEYLIRKTQQMGFQQGSKINCLLLALIVSLFSLALQAREIKLVDYPVQISQNSCHLIDFKSGKLKKVNFVQNGKTDFLLASLLWELKENVLHPNAGGRMSNIYITGYYQQDGKFLIKGWFIKGPFIIEKINLHEDTSELSVSKILLDVHFGHPSNPPSSKEFLKFKKQLKINYDPKTCISWLGAKPSVLIKLGEVESGGNPEDGP